MIEDDVSLLPEKKSHRKIRPRSRTDARTVKDCKTLLGSFKLFFRFPTPRLLGTKVAFFFIVNCFLGNFSPWDLAIALGVFTYWPFQEWFLHAYALHFKPRTILGVHLDPFAGRIHRYHHRHPWILETVFLPTRVIVALIPIHILVWVIAMPTAALAASGIFFFTLATLIYEWTHYITHTQYKPKSAYVQKIFRNHRLHHFKNENYWHSFTAPHIDILFGTGPEPEEVGASSTCRTLGVESAP